MPGVLPDGGYGCATWQCYMGQYNLPYIKTPILALNSNYDTWSVRNCAKVERTLGSLFIHTCDSLFTQLTFPPCCCLTFVVFPPSLHFLFFFFVFFFCFLFFLGFILTKVFLLGLFFWFNSFVGTPFYFHSFSSRCLLVCPLLPQNRVLQF